MTNNALQWRDLMMQRMQVAADLQRFQIQQHIMQNQQQDEELDDPDACPEELRTLFIANLDDTKVDDELLYELFIHAGPIEKVSFPKKKSFAFITYVHKSTPIYAMHLYQGVKLFGQPLVIKFKGTTSLPPLLNRIMPPDYGFALQPLKKEELWLNPFTAALPTNVLQCGFDNTALRNSRFAAFMDVSGSGGIGGGDDRNSRRDRSPPQRYNNRNHRGSSDNHRRNDRTNDRDNGRSWTHGADRHRARSNHSSHPYDKRRH